MSANRITEGHVDALLDASTVEKTLMHGKETLVTYLLPCGFTITGRSACVDPANFDVELGQKLASEDAKRQLWAFEGYRLQCKLNNLAESDQQVDQVTDQLYATKIAVCDLGCKEESHMEADQILCEILLKHGYTTTVEAFNALGKWYA